ncbi:tRNA (adenosine(37)-N6)-threonylcarbamoyltransferase complex ATPase subunit type 1 TsaE [Lysobacter sp. N42]|nr:tRNA (adenosine(37)-N6)-threonylcarbamoyltransferase complex ATPase subunit type 1 TsaE [Aliidiomarina sp. B3213]TCZ91036.1 tRNA (adenosine(37)-N6)-threonylcarbamoyltransferase complex ATPase subunit type 1 TsaE [Lysobacter sp. N42]
MSKRVFLAKEADTVALGKSIAAGINQAIVITLHGGLGMGKTTLSRGIIQSLGHDGAVKSPTYTLVEPYELSDWKVYHFDLYRLADPEELEFMGIRDYFAHDTISLIEWPERGYGVLPEPDLSIELTSVAQDNGDICREAKLEAFTEVGKAILEAI